MLNINLSLCKYHDGLTTTLAGLGYTLERKNNVWISSDDTAVQTIVDSYDPVPATKKIKIQLLKDEFVRRAGLIFSAIESFDQIELMVEQWLSIVPAARSATVEFQSLIDLYVLAKAEATTLNALTDQEVIWAYNTEGW